MDGADDSDQATGVTVTTAHTTSTKPVGAREGAGLNVAAVRFAKNLSLTSLDFYIGKLDEAERASTAGALMHVMLDSVADSLKDRLVVNVDELIKCAELLVRFGGDPSVATPKNASFASRLLALAESGVAASATRGDEQAAWQKCAAYAAGLDKSAATTTSTTTTSPKTGKVPISSLLLAEEGDES
jgi:hypothetical protein